MSTLWIIIKFTLHGWTMVTIDDCIILCRVFILLSLLATAITTPAPSPLQALRGEFNNIIGNVWGGGNFQGRKLLQDDANLIQLNRWVHGACLNIME